jgi:hypothetical protein
MLTWGRSKLNLSITNGIYHSFLTKTNEACHISIRGFIHIRHDVIYN